MVFSFSGSLKLSQAKRASSLGNVSNLDQPLVVHSKIKSSGYKDSPRKTMFKPQTNRTSQSPVMKSRQKSHSVGILRLVGNLTVANVEWIEGMHG